MHKKKVDLSICKIVIQLVIAMALSIPFFVNAANYSLGTYGNGTYAGIEESTPSVTAPSQSSSTSSSSSSTSGSSLSPTTAGKSTTQFWESVYAGQTLIMKITKDEISINKIQVRINSDVKKVEITVQKVDIAPLTKKIIETKVYQYLEINKKDLNNDDFEKITINFKVPRIWLDSNEIYGDDIILKHFNGEEWEDLPTIQLIDINLENLDRYAYFESETSKLSYFAIGVKESRFGSGEVPIQEDCYPNWQCTSWGECIDSKESRECEDINLCNEVFDKPTLGRECYKNIPLTEIKLDLLKWGIFSIATIVVLTIFAGIYLLSKHYIIHVPNFKRNEKANLHKTKRITIKENYRKRATKELDNFIKIALNKHADKGLIIKELQNSGWPIEIIEKKIEKFIKK
jgi:PGF-pre-PGF domain-containing protein